MEKKTREVPRLRTIDRQQMVLRPVDVDKLIEADHPARGIWELVGSLDLSSFYQAIEAVEGEAGRPAHDPGAGFSPPHFPVIRAIIGS